MSSPGSSWGFSLEKVGSDKKTNPFLKNSLKSKLKILGKIDLKYTK
jgi:hypothetical protein